MNRQHPFRLPRSRLARRRFLQTAAAAIAGFTFASCGPQPGGQGQSSGSGGSQKLHIYTWTSYTDDDLTSRFTAETGIDVVVDIYDSNEMMLAKLQAGGGDAYSIIYPSDYMVQQMINLGLLTALDPSRLTGLDNLFPQFQDPVYDAGNRHSIPVAWGTTGLAYNRALLNTPPQDWDFLWENQTTLSRRLTLLNDVRETMGAALKRLGYSYNTTNPAELEAAYEALAALKPAIAAFTTDGWRGQLLAGDLLMAMAYSSEAGEVMTENPDLQYVIPQSGSSLWTDTMAIPKSAPNPDAAYAWMNWMLQPEVIAETLQRLHFATTSRAAYQLLPEPVRSNPVHYPPEAVLNNCEGIAPVGKEASELYDRYWTRLTST